MVPSGVGEFPGAADAVDCAQLAVAANNNKTPSFCMLPPKKVDRRRLSSEMPPIQRYLRKVTTG